MLSLTSRFTAANALSMMGTTISSMYCRELIDLASEAVIDSLCLLASCC